MWGGFIKKFQHLVGCILIFVFVLASYAEVTYLNGKRYKKIDEQWYQVENGYSYQLDNEVITVKFTDEAPQSEIDDLNESQGTEVIRINILGFYDLAVPAESDPISVVQHYLESEIVEIAEPNTMGEFLGDPNDPIFPDQWFHPRIRTPEAWDLEIGEPSVIIGILDSGTDILHEDLEGNIWVNPGEDIDGDGVVWDPDDFNGVDDDGNGYIDDLVGWDFVNDSNDVEGPFYHGTHVAGIAGAVTNNITGVAGVAGGWYLQNSIKMLIGGVGDFYPVGAILDDAILYAAQMGADVITMSLTVGSSSAIDAAISTAHNIFGSFIDCAAGNNGSSTVSYPTRAKYVFAVGATNNNDQRPSWGDYGDSLDIAAPGVDIWSTRKNNSYGTGDDTSYSAPQVAGVAALLKSYDNAYSNLDIEMIIARSAEKVGGYPYNENRKYGAWDDEMGYGRVNAFYAVAPPHAPQNLSIIDTVNLHPKLGWDANDEPDLQYYQVWKWTGSTPPPVYAEYSLLITTGDTFYLDEAVTFNQGGQGPVYASYKVKAVDYSEQASDFSNSAMVQYTIPNSPKDKNIIVRSENLAPATIVLSENYPNPFNPTTTISFGLPAEQNVQLTVYSIYLKIQ